MKKHLPLFTVLPLACLVLAACGNIGSTPPSGGTMVVNPMQEKASLQEINDAIGCHMKAPAGISVSDERFFVISGTIGEYRFVTGGISYTLRASASNEDISGVYVDGKTLGETVASGGISDTVIFADGMWTGWFDGNMQYSLLSSETDAPDTSALYRVRDALG